MIYNQVMIHTVWILGDQLLNPHPALLAAEKEVVRSQIRVVLIESQSRTVKLPYQRKKLVLLFSAMRHYAEELRVAGYTVDYIFAPTILAGLSQHVEQYHPERLYTMEAAEYSGRQFQREQLSQSLNLPISILPNTQFLVGQFNPFAQSTKKVILENFYRAMRRHFDVLMQADNEPMGGQWNFDPDNRKPLPKSGVRIPAPIRFEPDGITQQVMAEVAALASGVGRATGFELAVTRQQAEAALDDFIEHRLADFGPYEDAMSTRSAVLFHSLLSPSINIGLLNPLTIVRRAEEAYQAGKAPINSVEGFVRQILGWREYIYWQYWQLMPGLLTANSWQHTRLLPKFFWDGQTELNCLKHVLNRVIESGYSHHIERLMLICNFCMLAGIDPAAVNTWFLAFYIDAYEWVVTPNVIGMGLNADGGQTATKPYIASANYIGKMSNYCTGCRFNAKARTGEDACPFNYLYWNFLLKNEQKLKANPRFGPAVLGVNRIDAAERAAITKQAAEFLAGLGEYE